MRVRVVFVMTHDSIGLGEDGPHAPADEHLAALRAIPNLRVWRPCDAAETADVGVYPCCAIRLFAGVIQTKITDNQFRQTIPVQSRRLSAGRCR